MRKHYPHHLKGQSGWASGDINAKLIELGRERYRKGLSRPTSNGGPGQIGWDLEAKEQNA